MPGGRFPPGTPELLPPTARKAPPSVWPHPSSEKPSRGFPPFPGCFPPPAPSDRMPAIPPAMDGSGKTATPGESHPQFPGLIFRGRNAPRIWQIPHPPHRSSFPAFHPYSPPSKGTTPPHPPCGRPDLCPGCYNGCG